MKNFFKVAFLSSIITAATVYVVLEWKPLRSEQPQPPDVSWASSYHESPPAEGERIVSEDEKNNIEIYQKYSPGVVNITTTTLAYDFFLRPIPMESGTGSGAIMDDSGHIVTNFHVIDGAREVEVTLANKTKHRAVVVGADPNNDLAVLRIDAPKSQLTPIPLGTSKGLQVGQKVLAIGNPYGLDHTLTTGIVSSLGRSIQAENGRVIDDIIQTDAAINPGNSGGPLLNSAGEIVGINTAILSPTNGGSIGIGFAIPADTVRRITGDLVTLGYVRRPYMGVRGLELVDVPWVIEALRLNTKGGIMVVTMEPNSPAAKAGIRAAANQVIIRNYRVPSDGDIILAFQGKEVNFTQQLLDEIDRYRPGDKVKVTILRDNQKRDIEVTLQEAPRR